MYRDETTIVERASENSGLQFGSLALDTALGALGDTAYGSGVNTTKMYVVSKM